MPKYNYKRGYQYINMQTPSGRASFYKTKEWNCMRRIMLTEFPYCVECLKEGINTFASDVDHIIDLKIRPDLCLSMDNLQCLCHRHHSSKTFKENNRTFGKTNIFKSVNLKWPTLGIN